MKKAKYLKNHLGIIFTICSLSTLSISYAEHLNVIVTDSNGKKQDQVVVFLEPQSVQGQISKPVDITIDQRDKEFIPFVTVVQKGTSIRFPNSDAIRHHVYSFSKQFNFQIPLYGNVEPKPIKFNTSGVIPLGCNIHDWMKAFVFVSETPYYTLSNKSGAAKVNNIPKGKYLVKLYHPSMKNWESQAGKLIELNGSKMPTVQLVMKEKKKVFRSFRPPTGGFSSYH
jgi:plastocyanin